MSNSQMEEERMIWGYFQFYWLYAGNPKGVVLTHENILATVIGMQKYVEQAKIPYSDSESMLSFLTLAHIFGRCVEEFALSLGGAIGYWQVHQQVSKNLFSDGLHHFTLAFRDYTEILGLLKDSVEINQA